MKLKKSKLTENDLFVIQNHSKKNTKINIDPVLRKQNKRITSKKY